MKKVIPVILCGGSGTRLWPLSREKTPKQFLRLLDDHTLLQKTVIRTLDILGEAAGDLVIVTLEDMADETRRQLNSISSNLSKHVLCEPQARNTAAAVAYATQYVIETFGADSYMWILPADHYVGDQDSLREAAHKALDTAASGYLVTFGIAPTRPETGYGYIQKADALNGSGVFSVQEFHEKPEIKTATRFVESGQYLWSSGMHLFKAETARKNFEQHAPATWNIIARAMAKTKDKTKPSKTHYVQAHKEPFETAVMERAKQVAVIPCDPKWSDIGSWESLWEVQDSKDDFGNACNGHVYCEDTRNSMILAQERLVTCVGMDDVVIIETGDSVLVANKNCGSSLKTLVGYLREQKRQETIAHINSELDWGRCRTIYESKKATIRECNIHPQQTYVHTSNNTCSQWVVAEGRATFVVDGEVRTAIKEEVITMDSNAVYEIINTTDSALKLYEVRFYIPYTQKAGMRLMKQKMGRIPLPKSLSEGMAA